MDALSRRSLLLHLPDERDGRLVLTSSRSGEGRYQGLDMQALDGGQRGTIKVHDYKRPAALCQPSTVRMPQLQVSCRGEKLFESDLSSQTTTQTTIH